MKKKILLIKSGDIDIIVLMSKDCCDERNVNESIEFFKHVSSFEIFKYIQWKTFCHIFFTLKPLEHTTMDNKFIHFKSNDKHNI